MRVHAIRFLRLLGSAALGIALLAGCSQKVVIEAKFPDPIVEQLPLSIGVYYNEQIRDYRYTEDLPNDVSWSFTFGEANVRLFERTLDAMFTRVVQLTQPSGSGEPFDSLDAIIEPRIDAFEFSLPRQSKSEQYAVWIRYNLKISRPDGQLIKDWPISAYGQADSRLFGNDKSMEVATVQAMRDAIASIIIGFASEPEIQAALLPEAASPDPDQQPADPTAAADASANAAAAEMDAVEPSPGDEPDGDAPEEQSAAPNPTADSATETEPAVHSDADAVDDDA